ncbi:alpha/beta-hydrolase [Mycena amicta]|nr:alpha/beta-hydrolase [Mycena amicta]
MLPLLLIATALGLQVVDGAQPSVTIKNGTVLGVDLPQFNQALFLGIPYAQPAVGALRLRPPQSINVSLGTVDATAYGPHCWSMFTTGFDDNSGFNSSEDCLTLNIIQPHGVSANSPVPVVVWIHGGGLFTGGSADFRYNGSWIVEASVANKKPIVFVSINYRLASLGFLGGKALEDEGSLNLGFRDQRLALHWVQENIIKFGGNPEKVTIMGESAGATSVHVQALAYAGRNDHLFNQVVAESGTTDEIFSLATDPALQGIYNTLLTNTSCISTLSQPEAAQLACIRALPIEVFRQNSIGTFGIVSDGDLVATPGTMFEAYRAGKFVKAAFLIGSNTDEGQTFSILGANTTAQVKESIIEVGVPVQLSDEILEFYPDVPSLGCPFNTGDFEPDTAPPGLQNKRVAAITGDFVMAAGGRWFARTLSSQVPIYKYRFNHVPWSVSFSTIDWVGHFLEVSYVFNLQNDDTAFWVANHFTATYLGPGVPIADRFLGIYMSRAWASFIATGDPNNANVPSKDHWPKYSDEQENMVWQTQGSIIEKDNFREEGMQFIMDNVF